MNFFDPTRNHFGQLRYHRANDDPVNFININLIGLIQHQDLNVQFIRRFVRFCVDDPREITIVIIKQSEADIGVSYVDYDAVHISFNLPIYKCNSLPIFENLKFRYY